MDQFLRKVLILCTFLVSYALGHRPPARPSLTPSVVNQILHRFGNRIPIQAAGIDLDGTLTLHDDEPERRKNLYTDIMFQYFNEFSEVIVNASIQNEPLYVQSRCDSRDKFAVIVHGWNESCRHDWVIDLVKNLNRFRGGCIICMDYSAYSEVPNYVRLYKHFNGILRILTQKLDQMLRAGFDPNKGYIFGFSFGAQLVIRAARRFGDQRFKEVDVCDPAGPGFDLIRTQVDFRGAAKNVQCIHTSQTLGTVFSNLCHQDWRMGNCGINQDAAGDPPCGSHGLCPYFYNSAFTHDFKAIPKPKECTATNLALYWPEDYKMGYSEAYSRKLRVNGELFALTTADYPFNSNTTDGDPPININVNEYDDLELPNAILNGTDDFEL